MQAQQPIALALILVALAGQASAAERTVRWNELAPVVVDKHIRLKLTDGAKLEGDALAVRAGEIVLNITKSSNKKVHPKGQSAVPREEVSEISILKISGPARLLFGLMGAVGGLAGTSYGAVATGSAALALTGLIAIVPVSAVAGYYAGKAVDRRTTRIKIAPDTAEVMP